MQTGTLAAFGLVALAALSPAPAQADPPAPPPTAALPPAPPPSGPVPGAQPPALPPPTSGPVPGAQPPALPPPTSAPVPGAQPGALPPPVGGPPLAPQGPAPWPAASPNGGYGAPVYTLPSVVGGEDRGAFRSPAASNFARKKRFIIAGASIFGLAYYASLVASSVGASRNNRGSKEYYAGLVPIVGPFVAAGLRATPNGPQLEPDYAGMTLYLSLGALQVLGTGLFLGGLRMPASPPYDPCAEQTPISGSIPRIPRPCSAITASFQPIVTPTFAGGGLTGTF